MAQHIFSKKIRSKFLFIRSLFAGLILVFISPLSCTEETDNKSTSSTPQSAELETSKLSRAMTGMTLIQWQERELRKCMEEKPESIECAVIACTLASLQISTLEKASKGL